MKPRHRYWKRPPKADGNTTMVKHEAHNIVEIPYELAEQKMESKCACITQPQEANAQQCDTCRTTGQHNPGTVRTEIGIKQENVLHEDPYGLTEQKLKMKCTCIAQPQMTIAQQCDTTWTTFGHNPGIVCPQIGIKQENVHHKYPYWKAEQKLKLKCMYMTTLQTTGTEQCHAPLVTGEDNPGNIYPQTETKQQIVVNELTQQNVELKCTCTIQPQVTDSLQYKAPLITGEQSPGRKYPRTENIQQKELSGRLREKQHDAINCTGQRRVTSQQKNTTQQYSACTTRSKTQLAQRDLESQCITQLQRKGTEKHDICFNTSEQHRGNISTQTGTMEKRLSVRTVETRHRDRLMSREKCVQEHNGQRDDFRTPLVEKLDKTIGDDRKRNSKGRYKCRHCDKVFVCVGNRVRHERTHVTENRYQCSFCPKTFAYLCNKKIHERMHTKEKPYRCTYCPKTFSQNCSRLRHERTHTKEKPHQCIYCLKAFSDHFSKKTHERIHTKEKPYQCTHCPRTFSSHSSKKRHERTHTKEKPYQCTYCPKVFAVHYTTKMHERTHTQEKPYQCSYCPKRFALGSTKKVHERTHTKEKPYKCAYCPKTFAQTSNKTTHERRHTKEKPYLYVSSKILSHHTSKKNINQRIKTIST